MDFSLEITSVYKHLAKDCGLSRRDAWYVQKRLRAEGLTFATTTLPKFAKYVLLGLQAGKLDFTKEGKLTDFKWKGGLPQFLGGYLKVVFNKEGVLKDDPDPLGLMVIRQFCEYCYKLALDFDEKSLKEAEETFVKVDSELPLPHDLDMTFLEEVRRNVERHYDYATPDECLAGYRPRYGPGTFSDNIANGLPWYLRKSARSERTALPDALKGISGYFKSYPGSPEKVSSGQDTAEYSELLFVPKDSRGPRVIIREPMKRLMLQMSYFDYMVDFLETQTSHRVNFRDQQVNRDLALAGSLSGTWATIDLKEASDRVSYPVVASIFRNVPLVSYFLKSRSTHVKLPSGKLHRLKKLSGMGSGLTFATMAFVIHAAISTEFTRLYGSYREASKYVYVYGDDIIVPARYSSFAKKALEKVGLKVNALKSFTQPRKNCFRESCGGDYLSGNDVGPKRLKLSGGISATGTQITLDSDSALLQLERHCRELVKDGMYSLVSYYYERLERFLGPLPEISGDTPVLGRWSSSSVATSYEPGKTGKYRTRSCFVPIPVKKGHPDPNVYHFIGSSISPRENSWEDTIFGQCARFDSCTVTIPRKIKLRRRRVSELSLF